MSSGSMRCVDMDQKFDVSEAIIPGKEKKRWSLLIQNRRLRLALSNPGIEIGSLQQLDAHLMPKAASVSETSYGF